MRLFSSYPDEKMALSRWLQEMPHAWLAYGIGHLTTLARPTSALWQLCPLIGHGIYGRRVLVYYCHGMYMTIPISSLLVVTVGDMPSRHRSFFPPHLPLCVGQTELQFEGDGWPLSISLFRLFQSFA